MASKRRSCGRVHRFYLFDLYTLEKSTICTLVQMMKMDDPLRDKTRQSDFFLLFRRIMFQFNLITFNCIYLVKHDKLQQITIHTMNSKEQNIKRMSPS